MSEPIILKIEKTKKDQSKKKIYNRSVIYFFRNHLGSTFWENQLNGPIIDPEYFKSNNWVKEALKTAGLDENTKTKWSNKAGCKCLCSPGFLIPGYSGFDIFVDYGYKLEDPII